MQCQLTGLLPLFSREHQLWEDKLKTKEAGVKQREDQVRNAEIEYEQRFRDEVKK